MQKARVVRPTTRAFSCCPSGQHKHAMVVAMFAMGVVQTAIDQIIDMVAVRHRLMAATGAMNMIAGQLSRAAVGIRRRNRDHMLIHMIAVQIVQMAIMQIIDMVIVADRSMAAARPMNMGVASVGVCTRH